MYVCRYIDTKSAEVNQRHSLGWTALMVAAVNGRINVCKYLLSIGTDPNLGDNFINPHRTANSRGLHSIEGNNNKNKHSNFISILKV